MLGRVVALLVLTVSTVSFAPLPAGDAGSGALDTLLRTFEYEGMSQQNVLLLLTPEEVHSRYYFVMEAESTVGAPTGEEEDTTTGFAQIEVRVQGGSEVLCRGQVYHIAGAQKMLNCDKLQPQQHYSVMYFNTLPAEIYLWGNNPIGPTPDGGFDPLELLP